MSRSEFDATVERIEQRYAGRYRALAWRTALMVALGYAGFLAWVLSLAAVGFAAFAVATFELSAVSLVFIVIGACALGIALWQAAEVLWLPGDDSEYCRLRRKDVPQLFGLMEKMRRELRAPRIHRVELSMELNASIRQESRLGILGWQRNSMRLGLPLMEILTPAEFESVLAHEYAHVSASHGRFGAWIYRTRGTWMQLFERMQSPTTSTFSRWMRTLLAKFLDWYWPRFQAYLFVISRAHEYAADRTAAEWSGAATAAAALWKLDVTARRLEQRFWPELQRAANVETEPPQQITLRMRDYLAERASAADEALWNAQALASVTDNSDTHPSLRDRIASFGGSVTACEAIGCPAPPARTAAEELLGDKLPPLRATVDGQWREEVATTWRARHHRASAVQQRVSELTNASRSVDGNTTAMWERAYSTLDLHGFEAAEPQLRELLAVRPTHAAANLALGRHLLALGNVDGVACLQKILDQPDDALFAEACQTLAQHFKSTGQTAELRQVNVQLGAYEQDQAESVRERSTVTPGDTFLHHALAASELKMLSQLLFEDGDLAEAYLVRKQLRLRAHQPLYVLCVRTRIGWFGGSNGGRDAALVERLIPRVRLPGRVLVIAPQGGFRPLARAVMRISGARLLKPSN